MSEIKVSLSIKLPGRVLLSQEEAKSLEKQGLAGYVKHSLTVEENVKIGKNIKVNREVINFKTRRNIPAFQHINISKDAYYYMVGNEVPYFIAEQGMSKVWKNMGKKRRLELHLEEIAESLGGKVAHYHIFED